eukprot:5315182-Prymnesium_polylepis.1
MGGLVRSFALHRGWDTAARAAPLAARPAAHLTWWPGQTEEDRTSLTALTVSSLRVRQMGKGVAINQAGGVGVVAARVNLKYFRSRTQGEGLFNRTTFTRYQISR